MDSTFAKICRSVFWVAVAVGFAALVVGGYIFGLIATVLPNIYNSDKSYWNYADCQLFGHNVCRITDGILTVVVSVLLLGVACWLFSAITRALFSSHAGIPYVIMYTALALFFVNRAWWNPVMVVVIVAMYLIGLVIGYSLAMYA